VSENKQKKGKHYTKPARLALLKLCKSPAFKEKIMQLRHEWQITALAKSPSEAEIFWKDLCAADRKDVNYHDKYDEGTTRHQRFQRALENLSQDPALGLPTDPTMWVVLYQIVLWLNLDNITEEDIRTLPAPASKVRTSISARDNHLYLEVTFATRKNVAEVWKSVEWWQKNVRPKLIESGLLQDISEGIKAGRPPIPDEKCIEAAKLKSAGRTYKEIATILGFPIQNDAYEKPTQSRTAQEAVKRGRELQKILHT
jgi:hypothetical protein